MYIRCMIPPPVPVAITGAFELQNELAETAAALGLTVQTIRTDLPIITSHWEGRRRLEFDDQMRAYLAQIEALAVGLLGLRTAISLRADAGLQENLRRINAHNDAVELERIEAARAAAAAAEAVAARARAGAAAPPPIPKAA